MNQTELARAMGTEYLKVRRGEASMPYPRTAMQRKLGEVLGVTPEVRLAALDGSAAERTEAA